MIMSGKEIDLSLLCPQFVPVELLLSLQMHGNRNSMMQNTTYNPTDQDPFVLFLLFLFDDTTLTTTIGASWFLWRDMLIFRKKFTIEVKENSQKVGP